VLTRKQICRFGILGLAVLVLVGMNPIASAAHSCSESHHINSQQTAHVSWDENTETDLAGYRLKYGEQSGQYETVIEVGNQTSCTVSGLDPDVDYYFAAVAYNAEQQESWPSNEGFLIHKDTTDPIISDVRVSDITSSSVIITWVTDEPTQGSIDYGATAAFDRTVYSPTETNLHRATLNALATSTTYFYRITMMDAAGNKATRSGAGLYFTTLPVLPTPIPIPTPTPTLTPVPLVVSSVHLKPLQRYTTHALITWKTSRPATSRVEHGATPSYGKVSERKVPLVTTHTRVVRSLRLKKTFYFRVVSEDANGTVAESTGEFKIVFRDGKPVIRR